MSTLCYMHLWRMFANIYPTYEVVPFDDVARITLHRQWLWHQWWHRMMMMMPQPSYRYSVGHLAQNQSKSNDRCGQIYRNKLLFHSVFPCNVTRCKCTRQNSIYLASFQWKIMHFSNYLPAKFTCK